MPQPKLYTREERLEKKRLDERRRKEKIKSNSVTREEFLKKDRERYARKKEAGLIVPRNQMTPKELKILRTKNKVSSTAYRKKNKTATTTIIAQSKLEESIGNFVKNELDPLLTNPSNEDNTTNNSGLQSSHTASLTSRTTCCNNLRRSLRLSSHNSISMNIKLEDTSEQLNTSSPRQTRLSGEQFLVTYSNNPDPSTFRQDNPALSLIPTHHSVLRHCLWENSDSIVSSNIQNEDKNVQITIYDIEPKQMIDSTIGAKQISFPPNRSSIDSTLCPNSPISESSIKSLEFERGLKEKFRKYRKRKSKLITELQNKLLQVSKENEMFKKRCIRLQNHVMNLKEILRNAEEKYKK